MNRPTTFGAGSDLERAARLFTGIDKDLSGTISLEELDQFFARCAEAHPFVRSQYLVLLKPACTSGACDAGAWAEFCAVLERKALLNGALPYLEEAAIMLGVESGSSRPANGRLPDSGGEPQQHEDDDDDDNDERSGGSDDDDDGGEGDANTPPPISFDFSKSAGGGGRRMSRRVSVAMTDDEDNIVRSRLLKARRRLVSLSPSSSSSSLGVCPQLSAPCPAASSSSSSSSSKVLD